MKEEENSIQTPEENKEQNDRHTDFEYIDRDIHIQGRITKDSKEIMDVIMGISVVMAIVGIALIAFSSSGSTTNTVGIVLAISGGAGVLFLAPLIGSFFNQKNR